MRFFFYGTLVEPQILRRVLGRRRAPSMERAWVDGFVRRRLAGTPFAVLQRAPDARVEGRLVRGLSDRECSRLLKYEGEDYRRARVTVRIPRGKREAWVFVPKARARTAGIWNPKRWRQRARKAALAGLAR
jgi:gamma-glutamylcyclotransferase (GGCT)/AIG2-like uncharacterized protein YtfP